MAHQLSTLLSAGGAAAAPGAGARAARVGLGVGKDESHLAAFTSGLSRLLNEDPTDSSDAIKYARRLNTKLSHHLHVVHDTEEALEDFWRRYTGHGADPALGQVLRSESDAPGDGEWEGKLHLTKPTMTPTTMMGSLSLAGTVDATAHYIGERNAENRLRAPSDFVKFSAPSTLASKHDLLQPTSPLVRPATSQGLTPVMAPVDNQQQVGHRRETFVCRDINQTPLLAPVPVSISKAVNSGRAVQLVAGKMLDFRKVEQNNPSQKRLEAKLKRRLAGI